MMNVEAISAADSGEPGEIDWSAGQELVGTSEMQTAFARAIVEGLNQTRAARAAGYQGSDDQMRSIGHRVMQSTKVKALVAWARQGGGGPDDTEGDLDELKRILWRHARGADKNHSIKATEVLHRLKAAEKDAARRVSDDPEATLRTLIRTAGEFGAVAALGIQLELHHTISGLPLLESIVPYVAKRLPGAWADLRRIVGGENAHHLDYLDRLAAGPVIDLDDIVPRPKLNGGGPQDAAATTEAAA
jgi:muconolactone delta-isomerase